MNTAIRMCPNPDRPVAPRKRVTRAHGGRMRSAVPTPSAPTKPTAEYRAYGPSSPDAERPDKANYLAKRGSESPRRGKPLSCVEEEKRKSLVISAGRAPASELISQLPKRSPRTALRLASASCDRGMEDPTRGRTGHRSAMGSSADSQTCAAPTRASRQRKVRLRSESGIAWHPPRKTGLSATSSRAARGAGTAFAKVTLEEAKRTAPRQRP